MRRLSLLCAALAVVVSGCATTSSSKPTYSASQLQELGEKCLMAGQTASALQYLTEAERKNPDNAILEYDIALAYNRRGFQDQAILHLQKALKIKPNYPEALNTIGYMYATRGQFDLARAAFEKALNNPFYQTPQLAAYNLGRLYEEKGDIQSALPYYRQALKFDPHYGTAWFRIGKILEQLGKDDEARHAYGNAVRESPNLAEACLRFGILSYRAGDFKEAAHALGRAQQIAPNTDIADEARTYLEKINTPTPAKTRFRPRSSHTHREIENLRRMHRDEPEASSAQYKMVNFPPASVHHQVSGQAGAPVDRKAAVTGDESALNKRGVAEARQSGAYRYVVRIGSFADRAKADEMKSTLREKGYSAVVKKLSRHAHGKVFAIQLQPVDSFSKANTLMTQLSGEIDGKPPVIVKVPAR